MLCPNKLLIGNLTLHDYALKSNLLTLLSLKSAVFDKEVVTINSQEDKSVCVKSTK